MWPHCWRSRHDGRRHTVAQIAGLLGVVRTAVYGRSRGQVGTT